MKQTHCRNVRVLRHDLHFVRMSCSNCSGNIPRGTLFFLFVTNGNNLPQSAVSCKCKIVASHDISVCRNVVYCHMRAAIMQCVIGSMKSCLKVLVASTSPNTKECQLPQSVDPTFFFFKRGLLHSVYIQCVQG
jgi:hypothetical protein